MLAYGLGATTQPNKPDHEEKKDQTKKKKYTPPKKLKFLEKSKHSTYEYGYGIVYTP